jgi:nickel/cobalt transporter (NicO) family protein
VTTTPAILAAAAGVAVGHAILPDHWVPLAVLARTRRYGLARVARLSSAAAVAHVAVSLLLGALIIVIGLQFRSIVENAQNIVIGSLLVATGLVFAGIELVGGPLRHDHHAPASHHDDPGSPTAHASRPESRHPPTHTHPRSDLGGPDPAPGDAPGRLAGIAGIVVPFGAAASPDLTILPVFLAATAAGVAASVGALVVFSLVTIATIVGLTVSATFGGYQVQGAWLDRWGNTATALVLIVVGGLVLAGVI